MKQIATLVFATLLLAACGSPSPAPATIAAETGVAQVNTATAVVVAPTQPLATVTQAVPTVQTPATQIPSATLPATQAPATAEPSATPTALASPAPSATPGPPTATPKPSPQPSATPTRTPSPAPTAAPTPEWQTRSLLAGPGQPGRLYLLQGDEAWAAFPPERARLLISDDYGATWAPFPGGLPPGGCISSVNLDYATSDALYASTCHGLYRWSGSGWTLVSAQNTGMVAIVYGRPQVIWATAPFGSGAAVIRSADGGATWTPAASGLVHFNGVANVGIDPRDSNTLYAIIWPKYAGSYLRRGTADGQWQTMPTPNDNTVIDPSMTIDGASGALYVVTTYPGYQVWRSSNPNAADLNDVRWEPVHDFGEDVWVALLASGWSPHGVALYISTRAVTHLGGSAIDIGPPIVQRSEDNGQTWQSLSIPVN